jgi:hypothetical protein
MAKMSAKMATDVDRGRESGQHAITVTEAEAVRAKLLALAWRLSSAGRGRFFVAPPLFSDTIY